MDVSIPIWLRLTARKTCIFSRRFISYMVDLTVYVNGRMGSSQNDFVLGCNSCYRTNKNRQTMIIHTSREKYCCEQCLSIFDIYSLLVRWYIPRIRIRRFNLYGPDKLNLYYYDYIVLLLIFIFCLESELRGFVLSRYPQQGHQKLFHWIYVSHAWQRFCPIT